jgi:hypothetical protein
MADQCSNNQLFDTNIEKCVSCRDLTVSPTLDPNFVRGTSGGYYTCNNNPIITYDGDNKIIGRTCDSGEIISSMYGEYKCTIKFFAKK